VLMLSLGLSSAAWIANRPVRLTNYQPAIASVATKVPAQSCQPASQQLTTSNAFEDCPSFSLNFSKAKDGGFTSDDFTVYTGKPEANDEAQYYTDDAANIRISNGALQLTAKNRPKAGYEYTSARIDTKGKHDFMYGRIVVRATLPTGVGTWPAIWMLSSQEKYRAHTPAYSAGHDLADGELDIAESVGTEPNVIYAIAHSQSSWEGQRGNYFNTAYIPDSHKTFHDYEMRWTPTSIAYFIDGKPVYSVTKPVNASYVDWPYDQPYYLIINVALGGSWGGRDKVNFPKDGVNPAALPASLQVQSIAYYPYKAK